MSATCRVCGATTDAAESFVTRQRAFRKSPETWCPLCWQKRAASSGLGVLVVTGALGVLGLLCLCLLPARSLGLFLLNAFFFQLSVMLSMAIHASAHAYAGHRLGWRIFMVPLGLGKTVFKGKVFGFETVLRAIPWCGLVAAAPRDTAHYRLKLFTFSAAGLFANVILLAASLLIMWVSSDHFGRLTSELDFIQMLFFANLGIISGNLWPGFIFTTFGRQASDGRRLLHALNRDPNKREQSHAGWFVGEGALCHAKQEYEAARTWFEKGLQLYPENVHLLVSKGNSLLALKEFREARQVFNSLLPRVQNDRPVLATVLNNLAYADVALEDGELLEEADRYSKDAMSTLGWHPAINGTRGAVLLEMGRVDEALPLLRRAMRLHEDPVGKAQVACWLAIAQARKGDLATSGKFLEEAVNAIRGLSEEQRQRTSSRANS
jgi:tetratricopeptide (TPR) repeat protein